MLKRQEAAARVAEKLFRAEAAIDLAIGRIAELLSELPAARLAAGLSAPEGQSAFNHASITLSSLARARGSIVAAHVDLAAVHRKIGLGKYAAGPFHEKEDELPPDETLEMSRQLSDLADAPLTHA